MRKVYRNLIVPLCIALMLFTGFAEKIAAQPTGSEVAILDPELPDIDFLVKGLKPGVKVEYFDKTESMAGSITKVLARNAPVKSLHILSHGNPGVIAASYGALTVTDLESTEVDIWKKYLSSGAEIYLYGCNIASGVAGQQYVNALHLKQGQEFLLQAILQDHLQKMETGFLNTRQVTAQIINV